MSGRRSRSRGRPQANNNSNHHGTTTVFGKDHDRYNEEWEVYDALTRAVKNYNHRVIDSNVQIGVLQEVSKNRLYVVVPFSATQVKSFRHLEKDISDEMHADVEISSDVDITDDAQIRFSFNILRNSFNNEPEKQNRLQFLATLLTTNRVVQIAIVVLILWFILG